MSSRSPRVRPRKIPFGLSLAALLAAVLPGRLPAQTAPGWVEIDVGGALLSEGFGHWWSVHLRGATPLGEADVLHFEVMRARRFQADGTYFLVGGQHAFGDRWRIDAFVGHGADGFFLPDLRLDASVARAWLDGLLWTRVGVGSVDEPDTHRSRSLAVGALWYPRPGWITEGEVRLNRSDPGDVASRQQSVAVTRVEPGGTWTVRAGWGRQAWQALAVGVGITDFPTRELSLAWRRDVGGGWGTELRLDGFHAPHYERAGLSAGLFKELR